MEFKKSFGDLIKEKRKRHGLPLRKVSAKLDIDTSTLSKIERGDRFATKELVPLLSEILEIDIQVLWTSYYSDRVASLILGEDNFEELLKAASKRIKYLRSSRVEQTSFEI